MKICRQDGALLLHWEVWLATLTPPPSIFLPPPRFCSSGHHHQYSHTLRPNLSLAIPEILFIKSHSCPYCIVPYDIPDWSMNIWFSLQIPLSPILTSRWIVTNFTFQHSPQSRQILLLLELTSAAQKRWNWEWSHFQKLAFNCRAKWIFHKPYFLK